MTESHTARFLFVQEIRQLLGAAGFEVLEIGPFMDLTREPTTSDWYAWVVARAV